MPRARRFAAGLSPDRRSRFWRDMILIGSSLTLLILGSIVVLALNGAMVAPNYSATRSRLAKDHGLGLNGSRVN